MLLSPVNNLFWKGVAWVVSRPKIADYLIRRAQRTPYFHLPGYMDRWWLFNGYGNDPSTPERQRQEKPIKWLPSIRIHHILREDYARDMHDHPWDARTIILMGDYDEERMEYSDHGNPEWPDIYTVNYKRKAGDTATLKFGEYHNITRVSLGGVWTMFFTYKYRGTWGFWVNGNKVPHQLYTDGGKA